MTEQKNTSAAKLKTFLTTKNTKTNMAMQQAQKMVNLFRSLEDLGEDFIDQYNTELLQIPNNAELMLNALVGGSEVRQYLEYLRNETKTQDSSSSEQTMSNMTRGYLPNPEQDISQTEDEDNGQKNQYVTLEYFEKFKSEQIALVNQLMQKISAIPAQTSQSTQPTQKVHHALDYGEIIEDKQPGSDAIAGFNNRRNE